MSYLVFDIETIPRSEIAELWTPKVAGEFPPLWAHKIVSIGMLLLDDDLKFMKVGNACGASTFRPSEPELLASFLKATQGATLISFNGRTFDMPVIQLRCLAHKIPMPFYFEKHPDRYGKVSEWSKETRDRYAGHHIDLCDEWSNFGAAKFTSLNHLAKLCGLPGKMDVKGADVAALYDEGCHGTIDRYCLEDVYQTAFIYLRWLHLRGELDGPTLAARVMDIFSAIDGERHPAFKAALNPATLGCS